VGVLLYDVQGSGGAPELLPAHVVTKRVSNNGTPDGLLHFPGDRGILTTMERFKYAVAQAVAVLILGFIIAFAGNAISVNGINPFRKIADVPVVPEGIDAVTGGIRVIGLDRVQEIVQSGAIVIDARTAGEYEEGHIPAAILVDYYEMGRYLDDVLSRISPEQEITLYCAGPDCEDSELLARELYTMGYTNLLVFKGGYEEWISAGLPVETGYPEM
jgi:rhodanese-related sulfurtransferase